VYLFGRESTFAVKERECARKSKRERNGEREKERQRARDRAKEKEREKERASEPGREREGKRKLKECVCEREGDEKERKIKEQKKR